MSTLKYKVFVIGAFFEIVNGWLVVKRSTKEKTKMGPMLVRLSNKDASGSV